MAELPKRTANTMSDAIAIASPNGRMSKRAHEAAMKKLTRDLFGKDGLTRKLPPQPSERERLLRQARMLRELAARGMKVRKFTKEADELEARANEMTA